MRITFVMPFASVAGGNRVIATYARHLHNAGHTVTVVSQPAGGRPKTMGGRVLRRLGLKQPAIGPARTTLLDFLGPGHRVLDRARPVRVDDLPDADVVVATWWETAEWVAGLPAAKGRKFYLIQDYEVFSSQPAERVIATYRAPLRKIAVSDYIRDEIRTHHGIGDVAVVPNSVDLEQFDAPPRRRNEALTVGFLYTQKPRKNIALAIAALEAARRQIPELRALTFGAAPPKPALPVPGWIDFHVAPPQHIIPRLYSSCDLWLFTSEKEGFGLPILEAMACRTPVLATRAGAAPELVTGRNGSLLDPTPEAFAAEIARFAKMPADDWIAFSNSARESVTGYTWEEATSRLLAQFEAA